MNSSQKKLYIHIGYPKTATSTIQHTLHRNHKLLRQHGYYYPLSGLIGAGKHSLADSIQEKHRRSKHDPEIHKLIREMRDAPARNIILSAEAFASFSSDEIRDLRTLCEDFNPWIVVYVRRQDLFLQSIWSQRAKSGQLILSFPDWVDNLLEQLDEVNRKTEDGAKLTRFSPDYRYTLDLWSRIFGTDHILVRPFERTQLHPNMLVDFLQTCGMADTSWLPDVPHLNVSPGIKTVEVLRQFSLKVPRDANMERTYRAVFATMRDRADEMGWNNSKFDLLTPELHERIMSVFREGNDEVAHTYLGRDTLFSEVFTQKTVAVFTLDRVSGTEVIDLVQPALQTLFSRAQGRRAGGMPFWRSLVRASYGLVRRKFLGV